MNEKMSFKMGMKFAAPLYMGEFLELLYKIRGENKPNICEIRNDRLYLKINHFNLVSTSKIYMKCVQDLFNMDVLQLQGVIQNGSTFRHPTHTSGHFHIGVTPLGKPPTDRLNVLGFVNLICSQFMLKPDNWLQATSGGNFGAEHLEFQSQITNQLT